jgi:hypothetical protein
MLFFVWRSFYGMRIITGGGTGGGTESTQPEANPNPAE